MKLFNNTKQKIVLIILLFVFLVSNLNINSVCKQHKLTMVEAVEFAKQTSQKYKNKKASRANKKMQLTQAYDAIKETRKKESTIRFSLLFNIQWPEKHAMPKEIELMTKVPEIETDIKNITKELEDIWLSDQEKAENYYINIYGYDQKSKLGQMILDEMNWSLAKMRRQLRIGQANANDITSLENKIKAQEKEIASNLKNLERYKNKLSELIGFDLTGYAFQNPLKKTNIDRSRLDSLVTYSLNNDFNMFKTRNTENIARRKVNEIYNIYGKKWGNEIKTIESEVVKNSEVDLEILLDKYNNLLTKIDQPWVGSYDINLLFFKIRIPKEWFKKEFDGQRYFDGEKYSIVVAIKDREEAINQTKLAEKELTNSIKDGFESLKDMWSAYETSVELEKRAQKEYDSVYFKNKLGVASYDEVDITKSNLESAKMTTLDNLLNYNQQLVAFNKITCGAIDALSKNEALFLSAVKTGDSVLELEEILENQENGILYYINKEIDQKKTNFGLQVLGGFPQEVTHYELLTPEKILVARRTTIDKTISIFPLEYEGSTEMVVRLYNNGEFVNEALFDTLVPRGKLNLINLDQDPNQDLEEVFSEETNQRQVIGSYIVGSAVGRTVKKIQFKIPDTVGVSFYKIIDESGNEIGKNKKFYSITKSFQYLGYALGDLSKLKIRLFDAGYNLKYECSFDILTNQIIINN
ncbi:MAG: hypothetical protein J6C55_01715 [Oscillospiraceae bacterium]|nr:hypothetical protein [Oscillospiraceae bacterium]